jgi:hypothetical protein
MRVLTNEEMGDVAGGTFWSFWSCFSWKPKCDPKPRCEPKPRCDPKPRCEPKPPCGEPAPGTED